MSVLKYDGEGQPIEEALKDVRGHLTRGVPEVDVPSGTVAIRAELGLSSFHALMRSLGLERPGRRLLAESVAPGGKMRLHLLALADVESVDVDGLRIEPRASVEDSRAMFYDAAGEVVAMAVLSA